MHTYLNKFNELWGFVLSKNYLEIQSHDAYFSKISWGECPQTPLEAASCMSVPHTLSVTQIKALSLKWKTLFCPFWVGFLEEPLQSTC